MNSETIQPFEESVVLYYSDEDRAWIAHGLRTDQIGVGDRIVDALADFLKAIDQVLQNAREDRTLAYLREAPEDIQRMHDEARRLPNEIYEVAHKMAHGDWPEDIDPGFNANRKDVTFTAKIPAEPCAA